MNKIKVYKVSDFIEKERPNRKVNSIKKLAIIVGTNGVLVFDDEGVGEKRHTPNATLEIGLLINPKPNTIYIEPDEIEDIPIKELMEAEYDEMLLTEFMSKYESKSRIRDNLKEILQCIDKIGLDSKEYFEQ